MNEVDALDMLRAALWIVAAAAGPPVVAAMVVGTVIALLQALTQVQEATLTFVPKIIVVALAGALSAGLVGAQVQSFSALVFSRVEHGFDR